VQDTPDKLEFPPGRGVGVERQRVPFQAIPSLKSDRSESLSVPPTATQSLMLGQATLASPQKGPQPFCGVVSVRQARPFQASATFASTPESVPTAMQNVDRRHTTPCRTSPAVPFGALSSVHPWPFHLSITLPTATQNDAAAQDTAASPAHGTPPKTRHACPSHCCAVEC
jgi:hypothetical protein